MRESIKEVLIHRDGMSEEEAERLISEAREELLTRIEEGDFLGAEDVVCDYFGLEPDYLDELLPM